MERKPPFRWEFTLTLVVSVMTIAIVLRPPQFGVSAIIWLVIMFLLGTYPVLHLVEWMTQNEYLLRVTGIVVWGVIIVSFGMDVWPKSILVTHAFPTGTYGPTEKFTIVDVDISNPQEDAVEYLELILKVTSPHLIKDISQLPTDADACRFNPVPLPDSRVVIDGLDKRITLDSEDLVNGINFFFDGGCNAQELVGVPK